MANTSNSQWELCCHISDYNTNGCLPSRKGLVFRWPDRIHSFWTAGQIQLKHSMYSFPVTTNSLVSVHCNMQTSISVTFHFIYQIRSRLNCISFFVLSNIPFHFLFEGLTVSKPWHNNGLFAAEQSVFSVSDSVSITKPEVRVDNTLVIIHFIIPWIFIKNNETTGQEMSFIYLSDKVAPLFLKILSKRKKILQGKATICDSILLFRTEERKTKTRTKKKQQQ